MPRTTTTSSTGSTLVEGPRGCWYGLHALYSKKKTPQSMGVDVDSVTGGVAGGVDVSDGGGVAGGVDVSDGGSGRVSPGGQLLGGGCGCSGDCSWWWMLPS